MSVAGSVTHAAFSGATHRGRDPRPPPARAGKPVADDPRHLDPERGVVLAQADGDDANVMRHEPETTPATVAALYVDPKGVYANLPGVEVWDEVRDARLYDGPWPVIAHPPCARWSRLAGFTEARYGLMRGDDAGCFAAALAAVERFGGVLEHPAYSAAWDAFNLPEPVWRGGWNLGLWGGASCYVEQGRYGLPVKKATWLYAVGVELPELRWGYTPDSEGETPNDEWGGMHQWRDKVASKRDGGASRTPAAFRDVLISMASRP